VEIAADVDWGTYELLVERSDGGKAATSMQFYAGWYAPADASATPDTLELSLDKPPTSPAIPRRCGSCRARRGRRW
jgi:uncharacterized protein YfaS (alpha-2-macroglobulin family)